MNLFGWYRQFIRGWRAQQRTPPYRTKQVEELPEVLAPSTLYLIGTPQWAAALSCPCGCSARIELSLLTDDRPRWRVRIDRRGILFLANSKLG
jgi:hypothetical protein